MSIRLCSNGHITGGKNCSCGAKAVKNVGGDPAPYRMSRKWKRDVTQAIRDFGGVPVADLRKR